MAISAQPETLAFDIVASAGAFRAVTMTIRDYAGNAVTGWDDTEDTLAVQVWPGDDRETLDDAGVSAEWADDAAGIVRIVTDGTHTLPAKRFQWRLMATTNEVAYEVARGTLTVKAAPGTGSNDADPATAPYTTFDDLLSVAPWIGQLQGEHDRAGLMEHQEAARQWFDQLVLNSWISANLIQTYQAGYGRGWDLVVPGPAKWLEDVLATGEGVEITPRVKRACALYACYAACMAQVTVDEQASAYRMKAAEFRRMAGNQAITMGVKVKANTAAETYTISIKLGVGARN